LGGDVHEKKEGEVGDQKCVCVSERERERTYMKEEFLTPEEDDTYTCHAIKMTWN